MTFSIFRARRRALALPAVACALAAGLFGLFSVQQAHADTIPIVGFDISWPQCNMPFPNAPFTQAIIGVNDGRPYTQNECFQSEWAWAQQGGQAPAVYMNLDYPRTLTMPSMLGPAGVCDSGDAWCLAYNYGYNAARNAVAIADGQGAHPQMWWLDIETMNHWSADKNLNARVVGAAIDYFRERGLSVGAYSTPYQWDYITGSYAPGLPNWTAGADDFKDAQTRCTSKYAFGGGTVALVQYVDGYDVNWPCPTATQLSTTPAQEEPAPSVDWISIAREKLYERKSSS